jgi:hypothetical protein
MHIKGYGSCMCHHHHNHHHHLFWKHQFFPRYMARWHFTRVNSSNCGPVTISLPMDIGASFWWPDALSGVNQLGIGRLKFHIRNVCAWQGLEQGGWNCFPCFVWKGD